MNVKKLGGLINSDYMGFSFGVSLSEFLAQKENVGGSFKSCEWGF